MSFSTTSPSTERYLLDTSGQWMLEALFDRDLARLEDRHKEYLAHFITAFMNPSTELIGVVPTETRRNNVLPSFYALLYDEQLLRDEMALGSYNLVEGTEALDKQFDIFCIHLAHYGADILRHVAFSTHPRVLPGFEGATGRTEKTPGVPDFIEQFLDCDRRRRLAYNARSGDDVALRQAFAIFQRGFKYAATARNCGARYLTTPFRWSSAGLSEPDGAVEDYCAVIASIASAAIETGTISSARDLLSRLVRTRDMRSEWLVALDAVRDRLRNASSDTQRAALQNELTRCLALTAAPWVSGQLTAEGRKAVAAGAGVLWTAFAAAAFIAAGFTSPFAPLAAPLLGGAVTATVWLWATPLKVGSSVSRVLRTSVDLKVVDWVPQSCGRCGAPKRLSTATGSCPVCREMSHLRAL